MTREQALKAYTNKFGGFPYFLMMGAPDNAIVEAVEKSLQTGQEIEPAHKDAIY